MLCHIYGFDDKNYAVTFDESFETALMTQGVLSTWGGVDWNVVTSINGDQLNALRSSFQISLTFKLFVCYSLF